MVEGKTGRSLLVPNARINSSTLNKGGTTRLVCTPLMLAEANLEAEVTSLMRKILEACSWRLIVFVEGYATSDREGLPQILAPLLMMMGMVALGPGLELLPVSLFHAMRTVITNEGARAHLAKV